AHQFHVVLLRLLLRGFGNRQQHKNSNRKASFHSIRLLRSSECFWTVLRASYQKLSLHSPIEVHCCSKSMEDGCQSPYRLTRSEFAAQHRKMRRSAAEFVMTPSRRSTVNTTSRPNCRRPKPASACSRNCFHIQRFSACSQSWIGGSSEAIAWMSGVRSPASAQ